MAKKKVVKDALVEKEKVKKTKKEEKVEEVKIIKEKTKKEDKKAVKKEKKQKEKKEGFFRKMYKELKKVSWPSAWEVLKYSFAVILFCLIFVGFFKLVELLAAFLKSVVS